jgi:glycosyltransferase involved in cell wall biosynthesis
MRWRRPRLVEVHQLDREAPGRWRATGSDPQLRLDGPFARGFYDLRIVGAAPDAGPHDALKIYYAAGAFSESACIRLPPLGNHRGPLTATFWLPVACDWLRLDPTEARGIVEIAELALTRRAAPLALLRGFARGLLRAPADTLATVWRAARGGQDRVERRRSLLALALQDSSASYGRWLRDRARARRSRYAATPKPGLFSILTTVYDTAPAFLDVLARSVLSQTWFDFQWVLLDNGSTDPGTRRSLERIARDPRVSLFRVERNLGIAGGMRFVLERASGEYVLPVDSDDYLASDALETMASVIERSGGPPLLYSDEDKLFGGSRTDAFLKPDWDPVLFRNCCYIAHLCAIRRSDALALGTYGDPAAEGCHDWDTFFRFTRHGHQPVHVPEILYSWRMHGGSTAANVEAKSYVLDSQRRVLQQHLDATGISDRFDVVPSPYFPHSPDWWIRRRRQSMPPVNLVLWGAASDSHFASVLETLGGGAPQLVLVSADTDETRDSGPHAGAANLRIEAVRGGLDALLLRAASAPAGFVALVGDVIPLSDEWLWEMAGLFEAFEDAVVAGGRTLDDEDRVVTGAGRLRDGKLEWLDRGRHRRDPGYFGTALKQRSADAVDTAFCGLRCSFLLRLARSLGPGAGFEALTRLAATAARDAGARLIYSPFIEARTRPERDASSL